MAAREELYQLIDKLPDNKLAAAARLLKDLNPPSASSSLGSVESILQKISAELSPDEWKILPDDLSDNLDHYLYGTAKQ